MEQDEIDAAVDLAEENPFVNDNENDENEDKDDYNPNIWVEDMGKEVKSGCYEKFVSVRRGEIFHFV